MSNDLVKLSDLAVTASSFVISNFVQGKTPSASQTMAIRQFVYSALGRMVQGRLGATMDFSPLQTQYGSAILMSVLGDLLMKSPQSQWAENVIHTLVAQFGGDFAVKKLDISDKVIL